MKSLSSDRANDVVIAGDYLSMCISEAREKLIRNGFQDPSDESTLTAANAMMTLIASGERS